MTAPRAGDVRSSGLALRNAATWLADTGFQAVSISGELACHDLPTWSRTAVEIGKKVAWFSVRPHQHATLPIGMTKALFRAGSLPHVKEDQLGHAISAFGSSDVLGVKLGKLTGGNTKVVIFLGADEYPVERLDELLSTWLQCAAALQQIGGAPGQHYGEFVIGMSSLGVAGFRFQQPVEVYPQFVYVSRATFQHHVDQLLAESVRERLPRVRSVGQYLSRRAPVFLQASFAHLPTGELRYDSRKETRGPWLMYGKPRLQPNVFSAHDLARLSPG